eukprot:SAG31_NODE_2296_length_5987_cov_13.607677_5_plen_307_part_00
MDAADIYRFDLQGYIVVRGVLSAEECAAANAAIDRHAEELVGFQSHQGMLGWSQNDRAPFTKMVAHPRIVPYLNTLCGNGFRMDHAPTLLTMRREDPGWQEEHGYLHGFGAAYFDPTLYYLWQNGQMQNGLVVVTFQLVDHGPRDGGLCMVPGSHKSNLAGPSGLYHFQTDQDLVTQEVCRSGDVIIFTESLSHGTTRWTATHERRSVLFRYSPANSAYAGGRHDFDREHRTTLAWPASWYEGLTDEQRAVLEPPYHPRHERPILDNDGTLTESSRALLARKGWGEIGDNQLNSIVNPLRVPKQRL